MRLAVRNLCWQWPVWAGFDAGYSSVALHDALNTLGVVLRGKKCLVWFRVRRMRSADVLSGFENIDVDSCSV